MIDNFIHAGIIDPEDITSLEKEADTNNTRITFVDATFVLPKSNENIVENFQKSRIKEAVFFDIKSIADKKSNLPHMLPKKEVFEQSVSNLGINNDDILIIYGQHGMIMGPARVWWMFKGFGHENVIVLNGGLPTWVKAGYKTQSGKITAIDKTSYKAKSFKDSMVLDMDELIDISDNSRHHIIDARPAVRFDGSTPEPRDGMRSGSIPSSKNLPCSLLVTKDGKLKSHDELLELFKNIGLNLDTKKSDRVITTCGSGITACALYLSLHCLGYMNTGVYDGSWSEWGLENSPTKVS